MKDIVAQAFGIGAFIVAMLSFQQKKQKTIAFMQFVSSALFTVNYLMLGATVGFWLNIVGMVRGLVFSQRERREWARHIAWPAAMITACALIVMLNGISLLNILPVVGMIFSTLALRAEKASTVRLLSLGSVPCWFIYNFASGTIGGTLTEIANLVSILVGMLRLDRKKANTEK